MPWKPGDAKRHTRKANSASKSRRWSSTANAVLEESGDEGKAVRIANAQMNKGKKKKKKKGKKK